MKHAKKLFTCIILAMAFTMMIAIESMAYTAAGEGFDTSKKEVSNQKVYMSYDLGLTQTATIYIESTDKDLLKNGKVECKTDEDTETTDEDLSWDLEAIDGVTGTYSGNDKTLYFYKCTIEASYKARHAVDQIDFYDDVKADKPYVSVAVNIKPTLPETVTVDAPTEFEPGKEYDIKVSFTGWGPVPQELYLFGAKEADSDFAFKDSESNVPSGFENEVLTMYTKELKVIRSLTVHIKIGKNETVANVPFTAYYRGGKHTDFTIPVKQPEPVKPEETTKPEDTKQPEDTKKPEDTTPAPSITVNQSVNDTASNGIYTVTVADPTKAEVIFTAPIQAAKKVVIPDTIVVNGVTCKVTAIAPKAFKKKAFQKKLTNVTIGQNVVTIGQSAFEGCKKLKTVKIQSALLTSKTVGSKSFKNIHPSAKVKVPKDSLKAYKKWMKKKGITGARKVTK